MNDVVDEIGRFVMVHLRDKAFEDCDRTLEARWKAPGVHRLQEDLARLSPQDRDVARRLVRSVVDSAIHDFLFALQEQNDAETGPRLVVDGVDAASLSDGLHGEPYGPDGWQARFSRFGQAPDEA